MSVTRSLGHMHYHCLWVAVELTAEPVCLSFSSLSLQPPMEKLGLPQCQVRKQLLEGRVPPTLLPHLVGPGARC